MRSNAQGRNRARPAAPGQIKVDRSWAEAAHQWEPSDRHEENDNRSCEANAHVGTVGGVSGGVMHELI